MENENQVVKQKSNKGVIIVLIILVLGLCTYIAYDKFVLEKDIKTTTNDTTDTQTSTTSKNDNTVAESKKEEVPITDKTAFVVQASSIGGEFIYYYIQDGSLYYYGDNRPVNNSLIFADASYSDNSNNYSPIKDNTLTNIKRIKLFNEGTGINPLLFAITEDGKVYSSDTHTGIDFKQVNDLKDYQVDDIQSYHLGDSPEADYKIILKNGTTKDIHVTY